MRALALHELAERLLEGAEFARIGPAFVAFSPLGGKLCAFSIFDVFRASGTPGVVSGPRSLYFTFSLGLNHARDSAEGSLELSRVLEG